MKRFLLVSALFSLGIGCSNNSSDSNGVRLAQLAETGTQADLLGTWSQACQAGSFTVAGFANAGNAANGGAAAGDAADDANDDTNMNDDQNGSQGSNAQQEPDDQEKPDQEKPDQEEPDQDQAQEEGKDDGDDDDDQGEDPDDGNGGGEEPNQGQIVATQNFLRVSQDSMVLVTRGYATEDCSGEAVAEARVEMDYDIEDYNAGQNRNVEMTLNSAELTFNSEEAAEAAGQARLCGIWSWQAEEEKSILGTSCLANMPRSADAEFPQILSYSGGNLSFGVMSGDGSTRPTELSGTPFTRNASADVEDDNETPDLGDVADELER